MQFLVRKILFFAPWNSTTKPTDDCSGWIPSSRSHNIIIAAAVGGRGSDRRMPADWINVCQAYIFVPPHATLASADPQRGGPHPDPESEQESDRKEGDLKGRDQD